jgi:hypothetical protein
MIACSCREILMGKHSSLGPVDPHFNGIPAIGVLEEIKRAHQDIKSDPVYAQVWGPILSRLTPSFVQQCAWAVERSKTFITETLQQNMLSSKRPKKRRDQIIEQIRDKLTNLGENKGRDRHFHFQECEQMGLNVIRLEHDDKLQDLVLTIHHCYMHTLANTPSLKIIENQDGKAIVKQQQLAVMQAPISLAPGGSASS